MPGVLRWLEGGEKSGWGGKVLFGRDVRWEREGEGGNTRALWNFEGSLGIECGAGSTRGFP